MQQSTFVAGDRRHPSVFFPEPRRVTQLGAAAADLPARTLWWQAGHRAESSDSKPCTDLLDIFLAKGVENSRSAAYTPPFFVGSPPARSRNPVVHDSLFGEDRPMCAALASDLSSQPVGSPSTPYVALPTKFGFKPAAVRVEGFDCLNRRDRSSRSITAFA